MKGTKPALSSIKGILYCSASLYPKSLPPNVGTDKAPVATTKGSVFSIELTDFLDSDLSPQSRCDNNQSCEKFKIRVPATF